MALEACQFKRILAARRTDRRTKLLSLGYPDLLLAAADIPVPEDRLFLAPDADRIAAWHNWSGPIYDAVETFRQLDIDLTAIDIRQSRGVERIIDLNFPIPDNALLRAFDIILDPGTLEHCFNIGRAFRGVAAMVAPGGTVIHTNPLSCVNHGLYSISPTLYADFYGQNGFTIEYLGAMAGPVGNRVEAPLDATKRLQLAPEVWSLVVVKAPADWNGHAKMPTQTKYLVNPALKA